MGSPVLGTEGPRATGIITLLPLRDAPVFGIEADEVYAKRKGVGKQTGELKHNGDARSTVVGGKHGLMPVGLIRVVVGPGTTIPVGTDEHTLGLFRTIAGDDISAA